MTQPQRTQGKPIDLSNDDGGVQDAINYVLESNANALTAIKAGNAEECKRQLEDQREAIESLSAIHKLMHEQRLQDKSSAPSKRGLFGFLK